MWRVGEVKRAQLADRFARKVDLALPPELAPVVGQRLVRRRRGQLVAACVGAAVWLALVAWGLAGSDASGDGDGRRVAVALLPAVAIVQLAVAAGVLAAQAGDLAQRGQVAPRASHLPRPRLGDYLSPLELWWGRGLAAAAVLAALALAAAHPGHRGPLLALAGACLGMWALIRLTVQAMVRGRPAASDVQSLAFDDALRADAARRLFGSAGTLPFVVALFALQADLSTVAGMALGGVYLAGGLSWILLQENGTVRTHFRRRLWPAAGA